MAITKLSPEIIREQKGVSFPGVTTCFLCYDAEGQIWMAKRSDKARDEHGRWDVGAGGLKWGVTAEENVIREVVEEYGATPIKIQFLGYRDAMRTMSDGTPTHWVALDFAVLVDPKSMTINEPDMFTDSGWFSLDALPSPLHSQVEIALQKYRKQLTELF